MQHAVPGYACGEDGQELIEAQLRSNRFPWLLGLLLQLLWLPCSLVHLWNYLTERDETIQDIIF